MPAEPELSISVAEAEAFAHRIGLTWLLPEDLERLRDAMANIAHAGLVVPRATSKFDQPAFVFSVAPRDRTTG
jgi:hypothetical protein